MCVRQMRDLAVPEHPAAPSVYVCCGDEELDGRLRQPIKMDGLGKDVAQRICAAWAEIVGREQARHQTGEWSSVQRPSNTSSGVRSLINGKSYGIGKLELVPLKTLRERGKSAQALSGRLKVSVVRGDVRKMHRLPENANALFQVASQFNLLEMTSYDVSPEHGVTRYQR